MLKVDHSKGYNLWKNHDTIQLICHEKDINVIPTITTQMLQDIKKNV